MNGENLGAEEAANLNGLRELALWLEGIKFGRGGNIQPLGTIVLDDLWKAIRELDNYRKGRRP